MLIILLATSVGVGFCLTALYNMWQIGESLQYKGKTLVVFYLLINLWNFVGRVLCVFISEKLIMKYKVHRALMLLAIFFSCVSGCCSSRSPAI